jgi:two-component sensor histidine kinase/ligand-binding sensor domain-containing protein
MIFRTFLLCITLFIFLNSALLPKEQDIQFTHLTAEDGLSLSGITQILQDQRGFLWFGTYNGLNMFDGYSFKIYLPDPNNPKSISNHYILSMLEDKEGYIWIATLDGLNKFNWRTEEFVVYKNNPGDLQSLSSNNIISLFEDKSGIIWIGTLNGLNRYDRKKNNFKVFKNVSDKLNPDSLNSVTCIKEDYKGNLWLGTWNGLSCTSKEGILIRQYFNLQSDKNNLDYRIITTLFEDNNNNLWIGLNGKGVARYNPKTEKWDYYNSVPFNIKSISNNYITVIYQDKSSNIWIGTKNGLNKFNSKENNFERILNDPLKPMSIINNEILSIKEDNTGIIWVGTAGGVSRFFQPNNRFYYYDENNSISTRINSLFIDHKENIWVGSFDGLDEIKGSGNQIIRYNHQPNSNSLSDNYIMSVLGDHKGSIWIGTHHSGLNKFNPSDGEIKLYQYDISNPFSISNNGVTSICEDHNGNLWLGTWWGLNRFDKKTEKFYRYLSNPSNPNSLRNDLIWVVYEDSMGKLWVGTDGGGASELDPATNTLVNFSKKFKNSHYISEDRVLSIMETKDGIVWLGTSNGLNSYDRKTDKVTIYDNKAGLSGNIICSIVEDNKGYLWIGTDKGLSKFNRSTGTFTNYTKRNGLRDLEFNQNTSFKSRNGILYFGCRSGLVYFNPDSIKDEYLTAPVVFTSLRIYNEEVPINQDENSILNESIIASKIIRIPSRNKVITIDFALLDFYNVKKNKFIYMLENFDKDWNDIGNRNSATFTNLPPGEYTFRIKALNGDGGKNIKEASIKIVILPEYYQTLWFRILIVFSIILIAMFILQQRTRKIKKQNKLLEKHVAERTKDLDDTIKDLSQEIIERKRAEEKVQKSLEEKEVLLKEIHHRVKNNLQVISSLLSLQSKKIKDKDSIELFNDSQNRIKSMALIHEKLYQSRDFAEIGFDEYVKSLVKNLSNSYKKDGLEIQTRININKINLSLDSAISCGLIINELMTNAFKYAFPVTWISNQPGKYTPTIEVELSEKSEDKFLLKISDNGIGFPDNFNIQVIDSLGLKIVNSMIDQLNGSIEILRNNGTEIKIKFADIK